MDALGDGVDRADRDAPGADDGRVIAGPAQDTPARPPEAGPDRVDQLALAHGYSLARGRP
jgi:hypothetical protein